jgi:hypothetical protein
MGGVYSSFSDIQLAAVKALCPRAHLQNVAERLGAGSRR